MTSHLEQHLQEDIDRLLQKVAESARLVETALRESVQALVEQKSDLASQVILRDSRINQLEEEIDRLCLEFLVRQQPVAQHLRLAYVTIKINAELERAGDYAKSIARQTLKLAESKFQIPLARLSEIADQSIPMLHQAIRAFVNHDAELARRTMKLEEQVDGLRKQIDLELLQARQGERLPLEVLMPVLTIVRRLERVADQAENICEQVLYLCTGENAKPKDSSRQIEKAVQALLENENKKL